MLQLSQGVAPLCPGLSPSAPLGQRPMDTIIHVGHNSMPCRKVDAPTSETSDGLRQELYALSIAHFVIRAMMLEAATSVRLDVDRLAFKGCFEILKTRQPARRNRINPRVIKRKMSRWGKCRPEHRGMKRLDKPFENTVVMLR